MPTISRTSIVGLICLVAGASMPTTLRAKEAKPCKPEVWAEAIAKFEEEDKKMPPPKGGVMFLGSSSIRGWDTTKWFPDLLGGEPRVRRFADLRFDPLRGPTGEHPPTADRRLLRWRQ
jgi:hypothetical protein